MLTDSHALPIGISIHTDNENEETDIYRYPSEQRSNTGLIWTEMVQTLLWCKRLHKEGLGDGSACQVKYTLSRSYHCLFPLIKFSSLTVLSSPPFTFLKPFSFFLFLSLFSIYLAKMPWLVNIITLYLHPPLLCLALTSWHPLL